MKENKAQQAYHKNKSYLRQELSTLRTTTKEQSIKLVLGTKREQSTKEHTSTKERARTLRTNIKVHTKQLAL